ncbi:hypothetical protein HQ520_03425 [bacterium]|nr:hypothetical protein [bacterium]
MLRLQEVDAEIHMIEDEVRRYPVLRKARRDEVERVRHKLDQAQARRKDLELHIRESERSVASLREDLVRFQTQQSRVKNQKEYEALEHEVTQALENISAEDEKGLEFLEKEELLDREIADLSENFDLRQQECDDETARLDGREQEKARLLKRLQDERARIADSVDAAVLPRYERLKAQFPGNCVVPIRDGNCGGCFIHILPRILQEIQSSGKLSQCDSCKRFLYAD